MTTFEITEATFPETVKQPGVVLIDWWAPWCAPCRMFAPIYEKVAARHPDVRFGKIDTESQPLLAAAFQIRSIPTLMVVKDGKVIFAEPGMMQDRPLEGLVKWATELDLSKVGAGEMPARPRPGTALGR